MFRFKPFGPFEVPTKNDRIDIPALSIFWKEVEAEHPGLQNAVGCYIFARKFGTASRPWYVGKTEKQSFKSETFQPHKRELYQDALGHKERGNAEIYLIAKVTDSGKFRKPTTSRTSTSIGRLEELLIGACLLKNPKLGNKSTTKHLKEIELPGFMGKIRGAKTREAKKLASLLKPGRRTKKTGSVEPGQKHLEAFLKHLEAQVGKTIDQVDDFSVIFGWNGKDYRMSLTPYTEDVSEDSVSDTE